MKLTDKKYKGYCFESFDEAKEYIDRCEENQDYDLENYKFSNVDNVVFCEIAGGARNYPAVIAENGRFFCVWLV